MWRLAAILMLARAAHPQSVEITFTNSVTHAPISGVAVTVRGPKSFSASIDAGVLRFPPCPPGDYTLRIDSAEFGLAAPLIHVANEPVRLSLEVIPHGKVRGRVLLPDRRPVPGAKVTLARQRIVWTSSVTTAADGNFTLVAPVHGRFTISVAPPPTLAAPKGEEWAVTYYPDATSRDAAQVVALPDGADLLGYDIRLRPVPLRRVSGIVRDDAGKPAPGATIKLFAQPSRQIVAGEDGAFAWTLPMGEWNVLASARRGETELLGFERLTVGRRDIDSLDLRLAHPFAIPVTVEGVPDSAVSLIPEAGRGYFRESAKTEPDGSRRFRSIYPGAYTVLPIGFRPGYYLASVKLGEREILGQRVQFVEGVPPIHITYKHGAATLHATVERGIASAVVVVPQEEALMTLDVLLRNAQPDADGRCQIADLRPGDYYVFAFDEWDREALKDPVFVGRLLLWAEKIHLDENGSASVSLRVTPWPE